MRIHVGRYAPGDAIALLKHEQSDVISTFDSILLCMLRINDSLVINIKSVDLCCRVLKKYKIDERHSNRCGINQRLNRRHDMSLKSGAE